VIVELKKGRVKEGDSAMRMRIVSHHIPEIVGVSGGSSVSPDLSGEGAGNCNPHSDRYSDFFDFH
jgi:hypothetical protein